MLRACGLASYDFNHALADQPLFSGNAFWSDCSLHADVSHGIEAWKRQINQQTKALKTTERKRHKLERELGPLKFVLHDPSAEAWNTFISWKRLALAKAGMSGFLEENWVNGLFDDLRATQTPEFGGYFSTLYAGERLVAAHFGLCSARVWHWWFPTFDAGLHRYSPGLVLLVHCLEHAAASGLAELDFGRGTERYKREFSNGSRMLCEGSLELWHTPHGAARRLRKSIQRAGNRFLPETKADTLRRASNRILRAGFI